MWVSDSVWVNVSQCDPMWIDASRCEIYHAIRWLKCRLCVSKIFMHGAQSHCILGQHCNHPNTFFQGSIWCYKVPAMLNLSHLKSKFFTDRIPQIYYIYYFNKVEKAVDGYKVQFSTYMIQLLWVCYDLVCKVPILDSRLAKVDWSVDMFSCKETCSWKTERQTKYTNWKGWGDKKSWLKYYVILS